MAGLLMHWGFTMLSGFLLQINAQQKNRGKALFFNVVFNVCIVVSPGPVCAFHADRRNTAAA